MGAENPVTASDQRLHRWLTSPSTSAPLVDDGQCTAPATKTYSVEFARSGRTFTCTDDENVLNATSEAGLTPPAACGQGMCGTCKTTIVSGTVDTQHNGGIRPREIANPKVLICCSNAERLHDRRLSRRATGPFCLQRLAPVSLQVDRTPSMQTIINDQPCGEVTPVAPRKYAVALVGH